MGTIIERLSREAGHEIGKIIHAGEAGRSAQEIAACLDGVDVAIDFTTADAVHRNIEACLLAGVPVVEGTTGWDHRAEEIRHLVETHSGAVVYGANFSIGVNLFYRVVERAAELFAKFDQYDCFIEEQHHSRKKDAPSGTALKLRQLIQRHLAKELTIVSTRAGNIPGTHRVGFDGPADQVLLEHSARSREGFALGAIMAAEWVIGKAGFFDFADIMDEMFDVR